MAMSVQEAYDILNKLHGYTGPETKKGPVSESPKAAKKVIPSKGKSFSLFRRPSCITGYCTNNGY